jgi:hypothetical protein
MAKLYQPAQPPALPDEITPAKIASRQPTRPRRRSRGRRRVTPHRGHDRPTSVLRATKPHIGGTATESSRRYGLLTHNPSRPRSERES